MQKGSTDKYVIGNYSKINRCLGESARSLQFYDSTDIDPKTKRKLKFYLRDDFIEVQRYEEATRSSGYGSDLSLFYSVANSPLSPILTPDQTALARKRRIDSAIKGAARDIEVLIGSGQLEDGMAFISKVLETDSSPETMDLLSSHLKRAGKPDLLEQVILDKAASQSSNQ